MAIETRRAAPAGGPVSHLEEDWLSSGDSSPILTEQQARRLAQIVFGGSSQIALPRGITGTRGGIRYWRAEG
jgi:hypothetical protein